MKRPITVIFEPEGRKVEASSGISVLEAAYKAGVAIRSECGGMGRCGKCHVIIPTKKAVEKATEAEKRHLSSSELKIGYRLACQTLLLDDAKILIPKESRVLIRKIQASGLERPILLKPNVKKFRLRLAKPTLQDIRPDLERLLDSLCNEFGLRDLKADHAILQILPEVLRAAGWEVTVTLIGGREIIAVEEGDTADKVFGFAVDIGTSKIVGCLVDLVTGRTVEVGFVENPQLIYGEDIISRIASSANDKDKLEIMHRLVIQAINNILGYTCTQAGVNPKNVYEMTVVGNTAMHHFFLGINPKFVAVSPFTPALKRPLDVKARELGLNMRPEGNVHVLPVVAGFVGADAVADVLASGIHESERLSLLVDIGTNTEVFVGNSEDILSCSCASGPAFEGGHIKHGMKTVTGAIERISIKSNYEIEYATVDDAAPIGLCGSAIIDAVAELYRLGIINDRGRFKAGINNPRLRKASDGDLEFVLVWAKDSGASIDITVTQKDINELQLAKAAIFAACSILMKRKNVRLEDIDSLIIAGAFGTYINPENAKLIGLLPDIPTERIKFVGNTALSGAKMTLISTEARKTAEMLSRRIRYLELASDPEFSSEFADAMFIPHKNPDRFPSQRKFWKT